MVIRLLSYRLWGIGKVVTQKSGVVEKGMGGWVKRYGGF
jgi:hypothetical protein